MVQARFEMEDFAIPEEYYSCPADSLFDLLADSLLAFARRLGWCGEHANALLTTCP